jgi:hypothetical protein
VRRLPLGIALASLLSLAFTPVAQGHSGTEVGEYLVSIGWKNEPAYLGQPNAVQVTILDHRDESPILDLGADALAVVVSTAGQDSASLPLLAAFDAQERTGPLGEYGAALVPTAPGDYTFHVTGTIHDTPVDLEVTSGEETFDPVQGSSDVEFPAKLPNLNEVATRLDRIDARIAALASADPGTAALDAARAASDAAAAATASANRALLVGSLIGGAGVLVALAALVVAMRAGRRGAGTA